MAVTVHPVASARVPEAREFVELPFRLYSRNRRWVPWFRGDMLSILDRKHPFFEHSEAAFFVARRDGRTVGRIAVLENRNFNTYRHRKHARFSFFDAEDDRDAAAALFAEAEGWARARGLDTLIGPMGFSSMSGGGVLVDGFEHRAAMTMMPWNHPYYRELIESSGFGKYKDFFSAYLDPRTYTTPAKVRRVAELTLKRGTFYVPELRTGAQLLEVARKIGRVYNDAWEDHEETSPMTGTELEHLAKSLLLVTRPSMIKVIMKAVEDENVEDELAGFVLAFPDLSAAIQRSRGNLNPLAVLRILMAKQFSRFAVINGLGILPAYQGSGGNALLYLELEKSLKESGCTGAEMVQIAETTGKMLSDMETLGGRIYKTHRVYVRPI